MDIEGRIQHGRDAGEDMETLDQTVIGFIVFTLQDLRAACLVLWMNRSREQLGPFRRRIERDHHVWRMRWRFGDRSRSTPMSSTDGANGIQKSRDLIAELIS